MFKMAWRDGSDRVGLGLALGLCIAVGSVQADSPSSSRQQELVHLVRQDCGSCHGLTLQGGLGPALTAPALRGFTVDLLVATISQGRPGTPMPPFAGILTSDETAWIARQLLAGFPQGR